MKKVIDKEKDETYDKRGLECRNCGCKHFRVIYTGRGAGHKIMHRPERRHWGT